MDRKTHGLRYQFYFKLLPFMLVCLALEATVTTWISYRQSLADLEYRVDVLGTDRRNVFSFSAALKWTRLEQMEHVVSTLLLTPEIYYISVYDVDGEVIYEDGLEDVSFASTRQNEYPLFYNEYYYLNEEELAEEFEGEELPVPEEMGKVVFYYELDSLMGSIKQRASLFLIMVSLLGLFLAIGVETAFRLSIMRPLNQLRQAILATRRTGVKNRVHMDRNDEIGTLATEYDKLLDKQEEIEDDLEKALESAKQAASAKGAFLANMSHEIRTPMNGVLGMVELLRQTELSGEQQDFTDTIHHSGVALLEIIDDILDLSKIEAGKFRVDQTDFDLEKLMDELTALLTGKARAKGIALHLRFSGDPLPRLKGDPGRIRQIILNFASNALKFTEEGYVLFSVDHRKLEDGRSRVAVAVSDTGIGIPQEKLDSVFDAFIQVESDAGRRFGGTGLGLSICKKLAELMGGDITAYSTFGEGSTFEFHVDMDVADGSTAPVALSASKDKTIMVVDPDPIGLDITLTKLNAWGFKAFGVAGIQGAKELAAQRNLDLVLCEKNYKDGGAMALKAELAHCTAPFAVYTAYPLQAEEGAYREMSFSGYLSRPVNRRIFFQFIEKLLRADSNFVQRADVLDKSRLPNQEVPRFDAHILVVDDNLINQRVVTRMLTRMGCRVDVAGNGNEAVSARREGHFDLIFMDCQMPELDGIQATRLIREMETEPIPIVGLSAGVLEEEREVCYRAGMNDFLSKPVKMSDISGALLRHLPATLMSQKQETVMTMGDMGPVAKKNAQG